MNPRFKLKEIEIRNFLSIGENGCIIKLDSVGSTLIVGSNGAGKTTLLEAITFALYNRTYRKINRANIVNSFVGRDCYVRLDLTIGNDEYRLIRTIKPNSFEIYKNGILMDELAGSAQQKNFENILGLDFNVYKQLIVLGTSGYEEFMSLSAGNRRKLLEKILKLDVIALMDEDNKGQIKNSNIKLDNINIEIENIDKRLEVIEDTLKVLQSLEKEKLEENKNINSIIKTKVSEIDKINSEIDMINKKISELPEVNIEYKEEISVSQDFIEDVKERKLKLADLRNNLSSKKQELKNEEVSIGRDISVYESVVDRYTNGGECPSCMQQLNEDNDVLHRIREILHDCETKKKELTKKIDTVDNELEGIESKIDLINKEIEVERNRILEYNEVIREENRKKEIEKNKIDNTLSELKHNINVREVKINSIKKEIGDLNNRIESNKKSIVDNNGDNIEKYKEDLNLLNKEREDKLKIIEELELDIYHRNIITNLLKDDGIRKHMIDRYIPRFNKSVQKYLDQLGADYLFTVDGNFNETILSRGREDFKYESFSRGEQARIDLAILFSWRDIISEVTGQKLTALFLDEVFDSSTDNSGVESIKNLISNLEGVNVFTISHKEHNVEDFDSVIRVNKVGRFSTYERVFN